MTRPLRIAFVCDIAPGDVLVGGAYLSTMRFAELLRQRGHHVIIVGARDSRQKSVTEYQGIPFYQFFSVPTPGSHRLYFQSFPTKRALRNIFRDERIEIVHNTLPSYACAMAKRVAEELHIPLVAHIHAQPEDIFLFLPRFLQTAFVYNLILRYLVRFVRPALRIICPSELGKHIYHSVDPSLPISVISNGVDLSKSQKTDVRLFMQKFGLASDQKHILFVGKLMESKGVEPLVRAMTEIVRENSSAHLDFVGTGPLMSTLQMLVASLGMSDHVTFLGKVSDTDLLAAYNACTLFVLPSKLELEGMVVLEAMACGKPILIANAEMSASKYFVRENGLLFTPDDPHDLAVQALKILNDDALCAQMGKNSLSDAQGYDIHESVKKLEAVYSAVLQTRR